MNWPAFTSPWLLAGLAAVALPVIIHYLTRAKAERIAFPPYQFLVEACAGRQAVHRLRTLVLLIVRSLAVLALVLLFTRPFLKPVGAADKIEAAKRVVIIVDSSLSMRAVQQGVPLFARATADAADILRTLDSGSEAAIILSGARPRALLPALSRNLNALHDELVKTQPTYELGDPGAALALAAQMLGGRGTIHIFSDFQESNWKSVRDLPAGIICRLQPVNAAPVDNVGLVNAQVVPAAPVVGEPAEVVCTVFNSSPRPRQETVRLELGDTTREQSITLPAYGSADAGFSLSFPTDGIVTGGVSIPLDDLREDNTRHLAVRVHKTLQLLLISDSAAADSRSAAFFISHALVPSPDAAPGLHLVRRHSQEADRGVLETADVFVLSSPAALSGEAIEVIARRLNEGAQLLVFLDSPDARALAAPAFAPPFTLIQPVTTDNGEPLIDGTHKLFADSDAGDWSGLKFRRHYRAQIADGHKDDVLLTHADGSPALTVTQIGKGRVAYVNIPLTPDGGDLIGSPMFPAMMHELLRSLRRSSDEEALAPGNAWAMEAPTAGEAPVRVMDPENKPVEAKVVYSGRLTKIQMPGARLPGIYRVEQGGRLIGAAAVNVDPRESDTRAIALQTLQAMGGANVSIMANGGSEDAEARTRPLWPHLAMAAAFFIALEMVLLAFWRSPRTSAPPLELAPPSTVDRAAGTEVAQ